MGGRHQPSMGADSPSGLLQLVGKRVARDGDAILDYYPEADMYEVAWRDSTLVMHTPKRAQADYALMVAGAYMTDPADALEVQRMAAYRACSRCERVVFRGEMDNGRCPRCAP